MSKYWKRLIPYAVGFLVLMCVFPHGVFSQTTNIAAARRVQLEKELADLEKQIDAHRSNLSGQKKKSATLERDISILNAEIKKAKDSIKAGAIRINLITEEIKTKEKIISKLTEKIDREKDSLAQILRETNRSNETSLAEVVLAGDTIASFFEKIDMYDEVRLKLQDSFVMIENDKKVNEGAKLALEDKRQEEQDLKSIQLLEQKKVEQQEGTKKQILNISKGIEGEYQKIIVAGEMNAENIRTELFGMRGSVAIPFEKAYEYASFIGKKTGVRPAFILGIVAEESNLGENVGTGNWRVDMKAPRDTVPFLDIAKRLGRNPDTLPVSKKPWYGYGGAMGPAQFIPSTWIMYEKRITEVTGAVVPDPWNPRDAFTASALLLKDNGAAKGTRSAERTAALCYLAGCANAKKKAYAFYGDDVMDLADKFQRQINIISK
jgi:hypothetical protein